MVGHELTVEQSEATRPHPPDQPCQRHLRRIGPAGEHAFAEEGSPQRHAIQAADQFVALPAFHRMGKAQIVEIAVGRLDLAVDPCRWPVVGHLRAFGDHARKVRVHRHPELFPPHGLGQRMRKMKAAQRQYRPLLWLHPVDFLRIPVVGHREHADGVGLQQQERVDRHLPRHSKCCWFG